jgi:type I restriction enzyme S subunit
LFTDGDWVESKDQDQDGEVRLIQLADVGVSEFRDHSNRRLTSAKAEELRCTYLEPGDVLIARMPKPLGRACIFPPDQGPSVTVVDVAVLRPGKEGVDSRWLMWAINSPQSGRRIEQHSSGTTRQRISKKNLATIPIGVPPISEQRRIVEAIEGYFIWLDSAEAAIQTGLRRCTRLKASVLNGAISVEWPNAPLGEYLLSLRNGVFVSRPAAEPPGFPILRISAVRPMVLDMKDVRYAPGGTPKVDSNCVEEGNLLFTRYSGNPDYVGACAVVPKTTEAIAYPDKLIRAVVDETRMDPRYIAIAMTARLGRQQVESRLKTTAGQVGIAGSQLKTVRLPVPPMAEQVRIVKYVETALAEVDRIRDALEQTLARVTALRRSILQKAVSGDLVSQESEDEPAALLLQRIQTDRTVSTGSKSRRMKVTA